MELINLNLVSVADCILVSMVDSFCEEHRESEEDTTLKIPVKEFYEQMVFHYAGGVLSVGSC